MNTSYTRRRRQARRPDARARQRRASRSTWPSRTARASCWSRRSRSAETLDFAGFWTAYEDVVRRARGNKLDGRRLRRHDDLADQPRHHRHGPLGAAPDAGPGHDRRRRRHGLPGGVRGHLRGGAEQDGRLQGADAHLDVRPPDHPGRAVRRLPADHRPQAARRGRVLRPRLRVAARAVRAGALGPRSRPTPTPRPSSRPASPSSSTPTGRAATSWPTPTRWPTASASTPTWTCRRTA